MEMRCYRKILYISYKDHVTNEEVCAKIQQAIGPREDLLTIVKRRKLQWYGHVFRSSGLAKPILQGTVKGGRREGRQRKRWEDTIRMDRPGVRQVPEGGGEQGKMEKTGCKIIVGAPTTLAVKGLMMIMMIMMMMMMIMMMMMMMNAASEQCWVFLYRSETNKPSDSTIEAQEETIQTV